jgi:hypothetical protein
MDITCIIARYNEDLAWTLEFPFNQFKYVVYNKGVDTLFEHKNVHMVISLPNVGRCDHTYLYHIIHNYTKLKTIQVFLPGSVNIVYKKKVANQMISYILRYKRAIFIANKVPSIFNEFKHFEIDAYACAYGPNKMLNGEIATGKCEHRPFGKWFLHHSFYDSSSYCFNGIFSIDKRDILRHPMDRYIKLERELAIHSNPEVGHYIERSWATIFGPFKYTLLDTKIKNSSINILFIP